MLGVDIEAGQQRILSKGFGCVALVYQHLKWFDLGEG
jgi:hypothetical protein